ncbi:MAG: hypothetical protein ACLFPL_04120 [Candidatus Nanoarchaeia archaeon]
MLCSLSPFFKEDLTAITKSWKKSLGKNKYNDFNNISFGKIAQQLSSSTSVYILFGEREVTQLIRRAHRAHSIIKNSQLIRIPNVKHQLSHPNYNKAITKELKI